MSRRQDPSQLSIRELYVRNQIWSKVLSEQCSQLSQRSNQANIELNQRTPIVFSKGLSSTQTLTKTKSHQSSTGGSRTKDSKRSEEWLERRCSGTEKSKQKKTTEEIYGVTRNCKSMKPDGVSKPSIAPRALERLSTRQHQKSALETMKARAPRRNFADDDAFLTMFRWSSVKLEDTDGTLKGSISKTSMRSVESLEPQPCIRGNASLALTRRFSPARKATPEGDPCNQFEANGESRKLDSVPKPSLESQDLKMLRMCLLQQKIAFESSIRLRTPRRTSTDDDDMFTMFRWSNDELDDEEILENLKNMAPRRSE
jgi:hypothetical protein